MPSAIRSRRSGIGKHQIVTLDLVRSGAAAQFIERLHVRRIVHRTPLGDEVGAEVLAKFLGEPRLLKTDVVAQKTEQNPGGPWQVAFGKQSSQRFDRETDGA